MVAGGATGCRRLAPEEGANLSVQAAALRTALATDDRERDSDRDRHHNEEQHEDHHGRSVTEKAFAQALDGPSPLRTLVVAVGVVSAGQDI